MSRRSAGPPSGQWPLLYEGLTSRTDPTSGQVLVILDNIGPVWASVMRPAFSTVSVAAGHVHDVTAATAGAGGHGHLVEAHDTDLAGGHDHPTVAGDTDPAGGHDHPVVGDTDEADSHTHGVDLRSGGVDDHTHPIAAGDTEAVDDHVHPVGEQATDAVDDHVHDLVDVTVDAAGGHTHDLGAADIPEGVRCLVAFADGRQDRPWIIGVTT